MAELRLIAALAVVAAGCGNAGAEPGQASGLTAPAGWQALPEIATAAASAVAPGAALDGVEAWGDPARGCYAIWMALHGPGTAQAIAEQVLAGLAAPDPAKPRGKGQRKAKARDQAGAGAQEVPVKPPRAIDVHDVVKPTGAEGVLTFAFEAAPYRGHLRARLGAGRIAALACFANEREPIACEAACSAFLGRLP